MFFTFAAKLGNEAAYSALGFANRFGVGVEKNCSVAKQYYYRAARKSTSKYNFDTSILI